MPHFDTTRRVVLSSTIALAAACGGGGEKGGPIAPPTVPPTLPPVATAIVLVSGGDQRAQVGQQLPQPLRVRVVSATGAPVPGQTVRFVVRRGGGSLSIGSSTTSADGIALDRWTIGTSTADSQVVEVRRLSQRTGEAEPTIDIRATALPGSLASLAKVAASDAQQAEMGAALPALVTVRALDRFGNAVPGATVAWRTTQGAGAPSPSLTTSDDSGFARTRWTMGASAGTQGLVAMAAIAGADSASAAFTATAVYPPPATLTIVSGDAQSGEVGLALPQPLTVRVVSATGIPIGGQQVMFVPTSGGAGSSAGTATTNADGIAQRAWKLGNDAAAAHTLEARITAAPPEQPQLAVTFRATPRPGPAWTIRRIAGDQQEGPGRLPLADQLVARAEDVFGNVIGGATIMWTPSPTDGDGDNGTVSSPSVVTGADGLARTTWTLGDKIMLSQTVTARSGAASGVFNAQGTGRWARTQLSTVRTMRDVWGTSESDVWAVGDAGTIMHFDGASWTQMTSSTSGGLTRVWGTSPTNVYASGVDIVHWDGTRWSVVARPPRPTGLPASGKYLVTVNRPDDALAAVNADRINDSDSIMRWNGSTWSTVKRDIRAVSVIWMAPDGRALVGQSGFNGGAGWHFDGTSWLPGMGGGNTSSIQGKSFTDVFTYGSNTGSCCSVAHYSGSPIADFSSGPGVLYAPLWFTSASEVYVLENGLARTTAASPRTLVREGVIGTAMWGTPSGRYFLVGTNGVVWRNLR